MTIYLTDGSLEGLLCAVFEWFERKPGKIRLKIAEEYQPEAFTVVMEVHNDPVKADRVWKALQRKLPPAWMRRFYCTFLSELPDIQQSLFEFVCYIFSSPAGAETDYGNNCVLAISKTATSVEREKHRMEAFIRFQHAADGIYYCGIDPDFNVLPLIMKHFKDRYADQHWLIYDIRRHYGIYYDLEKAEEIHLNMTDEKKLQKQNTASHDLREDLYASLWKNYFKSANIAARKNTKLHVRHVPKRYWKYLTEKV